MMMTMTMIKESVVSIWAYLCSCFTPTLLFLLLNLMIGAIAVNSCFESRKKRHSQKYSNDQEDQFQQQQQLARAPSVLERLRSLNLNRYKSQDLNPFSSIAATLLQLQPPLLDQIHQETRHEVAEEEVCTTDKVSPDEVVPPEPAADGAAVPVKRVKKVNERSGELKGDVGESRRREATARSWMSFKGKELRKSGEDEEVDSKADDFINRFKHQLRLQRLESIMGYKEMLTNKEN